MEFSISMDRVTKWITWGTLSLLFGIVLKLVPSYSDHPIRLLVSLVIAIGVLSFSLLLKPTKYQVTTNELIIHTSMRNVKIQRDQIREVRELGKDELTRLFRIFGIGGIFGYVGFFTSPSEGLMTMYSTRRDNRVMVRTINKKFLLTPDEPKLFINHLNEVA